MSDIWDTALARGMVIEGSQLLVRALAPIVEEGLIKIKGASNAAEAIERENQRRPREPLKTDIRTWGLDELQDFIKLHWQGAEGESFYWYFRYIRKVRSVNLLKDELQSARDRRDAAAHPEFFLVEDGLRFFKASESVLVLLDEGKTAAQFREYLRELSTTIASGFRNMALLEPRYPKAYDQDFERAEELWITGTNLRRIVAEGYLSQIKDIIARRNGSVKVLMHRPGYAVCKYAMMQEGLDDLPQYRLDVRDNLLKFSNIRADKNIGNKLEIKTIDYMLTFGLDIINGTPNVNGNLNADGVVYLRFYPLPQKAGIKKHEDQPIIRLGNNDGRWYEYFVEQFKYHWNHELAEELPLEWDPVAELSFLKSSYI